MEIGIKLLPFRMLSSSSLMLTSPFLAGMTRSAARTASLRTGSICRHMSSASLEPVVKFESKGSSRSYVLNRPAKLNALNENMLELLRPKIEEWANSELCGTIIGRGEGRAFCAGGDVARVVRNAKNPATVPVAMNFFAREFELDFLLSGLKKPYVTILDGVTMGGGVGLASPAPFRIATEKTRFGMPETKIGYFPDVGASFFLSRLDGEIGTYLALTGDTLVGRAVFEHGFATHYIPSRRIPMLLDRLAELDKPHGGLVDRTIEEFSGEREEDEEPAPLVGAKRVALDYAFRHNVMERIIEDLEGFTKTEDGRVKEWASETLEMLGARSPTSLKVTLEAIRRGRGMKLGEALNMELKIATAFCRGASPDFATGVEAVLIEKRTEMVNWRPGTLKEVGVEIVSRFFDGTSAYLEGAPSVTISDEGSHRTKYGLPSEEEIGKVVRGSDGVGIDELVGGFKEKMGVVRKIMEVISRRCDLIDNADGNRVWLKWKD